MVGTSPWQKNCDSDTATSEAEDGANAAGFHLPCEEGMRKLHTQCATTLCIYGNRRQFFRFCISSRSLGFCRKERRHCLTGAEATLFRARTSVCNTGENLCVQDDGLHLWRVGVLTPDDRIEVLRGLGFLCTIFSFSGG